MSDGKTQTVLGISGSLRKASYNTAALRAAQELAPAGMTIETFDLAPLPLYNEDVKAAGFPPVVQQLRAKINAADALLFACPEYNYSMSGVLKNAIDWASRPPDQPFDDKPVGMLGASPERARHRPCAVSPTTELRLPQHARAQQARGHDRRGAYEVRR
jgi:chromate reductase